MEPTSAKAAVCALTSTHMRQERKLTASPASGATLTATLLFAVRLGTTLLPVRAAILLTEFTMAF